MCGMAPSAKLVIYKVLDNNGSGEDSWIIKALDHIFETNERAGQIVIHGVNLSLGGEFDVESFNCGHTPLCVELRRLWRQGVVVVIAAGNEVTWAVLDSGIHWTHPHFGGEKGTIKSVYDCSSRKQRQVPAKDLQPLPWNDPAALDMFGHGAHVAGIIAGSHKATDKDGKERELCGMAPSAKLVIYKVLDNNGSGEDSWIIKALDHIFETNERAGQIVIHGVNLSLGGEFDVESFNCGHTPLCVELRRLWRQGVVVVIAAGNEGWASLSTSEGDSLQANMGMSLGDPANLDEAIVVGSVHKERPHTYGTSFFSSRGPTADGRMKPDCVAPGERILSVRNDAKIGAATTATPATIEQLYTEMSGTSMAAPHVSGLIAAFLSKRREFIGRPDDVKTILLNNCTDLGRQRNMQGAGMPNLVKMLVNV